LRAVYDDTGGIGKLYARQDEIGTPFCVTVDHQSLEDEAVTVRDRDTWNKRASKSQTCANTYRKDCTKNNAANRKRRSNHETETSGKTETSRSRILRSLRSRLFRKTARRAIFANRLALQGCRRHIRRKDNGKRDNRNARPRGLLHLHIEAVYPFRTANGEMSANTGEAEGTAKLVGNTAVFKPEGTEQCILTLVFKPSRLIVTQKELIVNADSASTLTRRATTS
jgi:hypothetical protein